MKRIVTETDTQDKTTVVTITVEPVADRANLVTQDILGDEDTYISLSSLSARLIGSKMALVCLWH
ncbi:hypothetical protein OK016_25145 [Vibrio chagasii]|nr:hypothetical protein [Vibrio chagasii]